MVDTGQHGNGRLTCSVVVPVAEGHFPLLNGLMKNLSCSTRLPDEVIIAASGMSSVKDFLDVTAPFQLRVVKQVSKAYAGENRNRGWDAARSDVVVFCDADDLFKSNRVERVMSVFEEYDADLVYHSFAFMWPKHLFELLRSSGGLIGPDEIRNANPQAHYASANNVSRGAANLRLPRGGGHGARRIAHGHVSVRRPIRLRFGPEPLGEDGLFAQRAVAAGYQLYFLDEALSLYMPLTTGGLAKYGFGRLRHLGSRARRAARRRIQE